MLKSCTVVELALFVKLCSPSRSSHPSLRGQRSVFNSGRPPSSPPPGLCGASSLAFLSLCGVAFFFIFLLLNPLLSRRLAPSHPSLLFHTRWRAVIPCFLGEEKTERPRRCHAGLCLTAVSERLPGSDDVCVSV